MALGYVSNAQDVFPDSFPIGIIITIASENLLVGLP